MTKTISTEVRRLVKEYYSGNGEKARVTDKIQRTSYSGQPEYAYVCKVIDEQKQVVWTVVDADCYDAHGDRYVTEILSNYDKDIAVDSWVHALEDEDDYAFLDDEE